MGLNTFHNVNMYIRSAHKNEKMWVHRLFGLNHNGKFTLLHFSMTFSKLNIQARACKSLIISGVSARSHIILPT